MVTKISQGLGHLTMRSINVSLKSAPAQRLLHEARQIAFKPYENKHV